MSDEKHNEQQSAQAAHGHGGGGQRGHAPGGHGGGDHEEHEGAPEWLISFADNVTLMMGFFVIMLAMAMATQAGVSSGGGGAKGEGGGESALSNVYLDWALGVREGFNNPVDPYSTAQGDAALVRRLRARLGMADAVEDGAQGRDHDVQSIRPTDYFGGGGWLGFAQDSAEITPESAQRIAALAEHFRGLATVLEVRGHCSALEAHAHADHGMELSFQRARAVATALAGAGIDWERMRLLACADAERNAPPAFDAAAHAANQRVEVVERRVSSD